MRIVRVTCKIWNDRTQYETGFHIVNHYFVVIEDFKSVAHGNLTP